jgi:MFS transporter, Spinster family, sphingosine-1-phosphate transporter
MSAPIHTKPLPGAYAALILLFIINMVNYMDRYLLSAVAPVARDDLLPNIPEADQLADMGILQGIFMVAYMVTAPFFGWLSDRYSRWKLVGLGLIIWSIATGLSGICTGFWSMLFFRCLVGVGEAAYAPAAPAILADLFPLKHRGKAITFFYIAIPVGSALGYIYGGKMQAAFDWRMAFYCMAPPGLILAIICFIMREPKRGEAEGADYQPSTAPRWKNYWKIITNKSFLYCCLGMTAMTFAVGGITAHMPTYVSHRLLIEDEKLKEMKQINPKEAEKEALKQANDLFGMIVVVGSLLSTILGGWLADYLRPRFPGSYFLVSGITMFAAFAFFLLFLNGTLSMLGLTLMFFTIFFVFANTGPTNTILANVIHPSMRQMAVAICILMIHSLGDVISPWIIGKVAGSDEGLNKGFLVVSAFILIAGIIWCLGARYLEKDTANAPKMLDDEKQP